MYIIKSHLIAITCWSCWVPDSFRLLWSFLAEIWQADHTGHTDPTVEWLEASGTPESLLRAHGASYQVLCLSQMVTFLVLPRPTHHRDSQGNVLRSVAIAMSRKSGTCYFLATYIVRHMLLRLQDLLSLPMLNVSIAFPCFLLLIPFWWPATSLPHDVVGIIPVLASQVTDVTVARPLLGSWDVQGAEVKWVSKVHRPVQWRPVSGSLSLAVWGCNWEPLEKSSLCQLDWALYVALIFCPLKKGSSGRFKRHCGSQWFAKRILATLDLALDQYCMGPIVIQIMNITVF